MTDKTNEGQIIDVRTSAEYSASHVDGAVNLAVEDIARGKLPEYAKDKKIYLYCRTGGRSGEASSLLKAAGFTNIEDLGSFANAQAFSKSLN